MKTSTVTPPKSKRIAAIDWMRGFVMVLMMIDHASMAFDGRHFSADSAALFNPETLPGAFAFLTRWITHLCAPTFVFLAGTALAISVGSRKKKGMNPKDIDRGILTRGLFIAILDPTLISLFSGRLTFQVLYAIGVSMMCMAFLRRLSSKLLLTLAFGWLIFGELLVKLLWDPTLGNPSIPTALGMAFYYEPLFRISYPLLPWLSLMCIGWVFGRYIVDLKNPELKRIQPVPLLTLTGIISLVVFAVVRALNAYGNMFLTPESSDWIHFLLVSKYPPSLSFMALEIGLLCLIMAGMMRMEKRIGVRKNGVLLVFGQTSMFFYLIHRLVMEGLAQWGGLRGAGGIITTYVVSLVFLIILYPLCRWYRSYKQEHPGGWTQFI